MKSRNLKAIFASVLTVALLATAVTGFAANVTTKSTYNTDDSAKVEVKATVNTTSVDSEVTYLVKNVEDEIVYIDQATAKGGIAEFSYKIAKTKIADYANVEVTFGTDGADNQFAGDVGNLGFTALANQSTDTYTVTYAGGAEVAGIDETVTAIIAAKEDFEITAVYVNGKKQDGNPASVLVDRDDVITADVVEKVTTPTIQSAYAVDTDGGHVTIIKVSGNPYEVGVVYNDNRYPAITGLGDNNMLAVKLILPDDVVADGSDFQAYYKIDENADEETTATPIQ